MVSTAKRLDQRLATLAPGASAGVTGTTMNRQQAIELVRKTFEAPFEREGYIRFLRELLNGFDDEGARVNQGARIPGKFQEYVEKMERVGKYVADKSEIMLFIVYLKRETSIERARTMQRNFVAWYLSQGNKDAALVAFVSPNSVDWRFSLVKMDYRFEEQNGKPKVKEEFTPARRWSFLVGANEKSHTAQSKFVPILEDDENDPTLERLEDAFNIEKVTKEFFEKYRDLFIRTKAELDKAVAANPKARADFQNKGIDTVNLAKKLLGQMIFLYFLQKKGWFGVPRDAEWGEGSKNFLRELFAKKKAGENFFNDILEPLFYEALRIDRSHDDHYYSRFNCKIPFLNGGLFDPMNNYDWVHTDILLPDKLFSNKTKTKEGDEGDGILDVFDRYNFTVKEDEPFEKEVAIDPELLGKAYEKFNAIRPDNYDEFLKALKSGKKGEESKFNKQYGVYYTPREIVHYMCQQSLVNFLFSELNPNVVFQKLGDESLDMFGNAVKDGQLDLTVEHRPMTEVSKEDIETLILRGEQIKEHEARVNAAGKETDTYSYQMPESIRRNAALIDRKLAEIKICDPAVGSGAFPVGMMSEIVRARDVLKTWTRNDKSPYDCKRECIENSLYGVDIDSGAVEIAKLRLWLSLVVDEDDPQNIKPLPNLDYKIVRGNSLLGFPMNWGTSVEKEIEALIHKHFAETNPKKKSELKDLIDQKIESRYKASLKTFGYQIDFDFKTVFAGVFHENNGFDIVIGNPPYGAKISTETLNKIRLLYPASIKGKVESYRIFIERGIQIARPNGVLSYIVPNTWMFLEQAVSLRQYILKNTCLKSIVALPQTVFEATVDSIAFLLTTSLPSQKSETSVFEVPLKESVNNLGSYLRQGVQYTQLNWLESEKSIITYGQSDISRNIIQKIKVKHRSFGDFVYIRQGLIPYLTKEEGEENKYISSQRKDKSWSEYLDGSRCVDRYYIKGDVSYIKYGNWLYAPREPEIFEKPRIIYQLIRNISLKRRIVATYLDGKLYSDRNTGLIFVKPESNLDLKYVLGILNSSLLNFIHAKNHNSTYISFPSIEAMPLAIADSNVQREIIKLVDRVLAAKRANPQADTSQMEEEIDELVYALYGLTEEEITIVEG